MIGRLVPVVFLIMSILTASLSYGRNYVDPATGIDFILVKGGCYKMIDQASGSKDNQRVASQEQKSDQGQNESCFNDFYLGRFEVTQGQWKAVMGFNPSYFRIEEGAERRLLCGLTLCAGSQHETVSGDLFPVESVSWNEVQEFIQKLNQRTGSRYRLPTQLEWEYAATGGPTGKNEKWAGTDFESDLWKYAWYGDTSGYRSYPVGQKMPNQLGFYDLTGNVREWVDDSYPSDYAAVKFERARERRFPGNPRSVRGGSWYDPPWFAMISTNEGMHPTTRSNAVGFRLAFSTEQPPPKPAPPPKQRVEVAPPPPSPPPQATLEPVYFDLDKFNIRADAAEALKRNLEWFRQNPGKKVRVEGNADERAPTKYNQILGRKRAEAVRQYLTGLGIDANLLETATYGKEKPICTERSEDCYWKNRRVDLKPAL